MKAIPRIQMCGNTERHPGPARALLSRERSVLIQDLLPTTAQHCDVAVLKLENNLRVKDIHGPREFASYSLHIIQNAGLCAMKLSVSLWPPLAVQY